MLNYARELTIALLAFGGVCCGQPTIQGIFNGASYSGAMAPGAWVSIFGTSLAPSALSASGSPLPTKLNGVSVTIGGVAAPLVYVSPGQINATIPFEVTIPTSPSTDTPVIVQTSAASSSAFNIRLSKDAPALFTQNQAGTGAALVFDPGFKPVSAIQTGSPIVLYAVGLGATSPPASSASGGATSAPFNVVQDNLRVYVGDQPADVAFAGLAPGFPGIYQLNVVPNAPISDRVYLQQGGWQSNIATAPITGGANTANVSGSIDGLYPATGANATNLGGSVFGPVSASVMLTAASFNVTFDIQPNAKPFSIVATTEAGTSIVNIDPVHSSYQASVSVPTLAARVGNFSAAQFLIYDFLTCSPSGCLVFPNNIIPVSRLDPIQLKALSNLPLPSASTSPDGMNSILVSSGTLPSTHVVLDSSSMGLNFGGFLQIAHAGATPRSTTFSLYVDGVLIASKTASYTVD
jgi:uncharacterized protein (TIGR03437 family)